MRCAISLRAMSVAPAQDKPGISTPFATPAPDPIAPAEPMFPQQPLLSQQVSILRSNLCLNFAASSMGDCRRSSPCKQSDPTHLYTVWMRQTVTDLAPWTCNTSCEIAVSAHPPMTSVCRGLKTEHMFYMCTRSCTHSFRDRH